MSTAKPWPQSAILDVFKDSAGALPALGNSIALGVGTALVMLPHCLIGLMRRVSVIQD
ncbi:hypothetical protein PY650_10020 [Rhizobium calliandrae]|uniref:Uncharacterized protein n=1 Tax=Rhizobium calliandrae TaxID=1312182 RepID=A0ABT7KFN9_9HYPH|nr:hypothetical protein [Rhizobium calliandrae]MDL2405994.1 hypothetical protein [Rhizobium calliandrae]